MYVTNICPSVLNFKVQYPCLNLYILPQSQIFHANLHINLLLLQHSHLKLDQAIQFLNEKEMKMFEWLIHTQMVYFTKDQDNIKCLPMA